MATKYIISAVLGSFAVAYACDFLTSDKKIFGGKLRLSSLRFTKIINVLQQF